MFILKHPANYCTTEKLIEFQNRLKDSEELVTNEIDAKLHDSYRDKERSKKFRKIIIGDINSKIHDTYKALSSDFASLVKISKEHKEHKK